ncbi:putative ABC transport system permease protein [Paenibacillus sophorae]|uniref:ABC transporter permease n=1 Tax=Paenibacillus sophorae TaxID=1333845 RepID=A0A1H8SQZ0_9BACL|nr:ABC transporter permease [Paenibacillus sophorae]QWU15511.1 ABC transporter permease [Paenibacillus sophorae]SEO80593.1 putative ABC transport system permease protein [Paenibacillus sophorae]
MAVNHLALSMLRKHKSSAAILFVLLLLTVLVMNTGLTLFLRLNAFYDAKTAELSGADFVANLPDDGSLDKKKTFLLDQPAVAKLESEESLVLNEIQFPYNGGVLSILPVFLDADTGRTLSPLRLTERLRNVQEPQIYAPYILKSGGGYKLGDSLTLTDSSLKRRSYIIGGFFQDTLLGNTLGGSLKFYFPHREFAELKAELGGNHYIFLSVRTANGAHPGKLTDTFNKTFPMDPTSSRILADTDSMSLNYTLPLTLISLVLVAFAVVVLLVAGVVVRFRVASGIEDDMESIGALKAIGYTGRQITAALFLQQFVILCIAGAAGAVLAWAVLPLLGNMISSSVGLLWTQTADPRISALGFALVSVFVCAVTYSSARKALKVTPLTALRKGITTHSFKRNRFSLEHAKGALQMSLGLKRMLHRFRQNALVAVIIAGLTFTSLCSFILYFNLAKDSSFIYRFIGMEQCDVMVVAEEGPSAGKIFTEIENMDGVKKTGMLDRLYAGLEDRSVLMNVSSDYGRLDWETLYEGRQPVYDNEISISGVMSQRLDKRIGDLVKVSLGGKSGEYLITGLTQQFGNAESASVTLEGLRRIHPEYRQNSLSIYLEGADSKEFIRKVKAEYGKDLIMVMDVKATLNSQIGSLVNAIFLVTVVVMAATVLVVALILYLVIHTLIVKQRTEFGILKAIGHTTRQLMLQVAFGFVPVVAAGVTAGGLAGVALTNGFLSLLFARSGIFNANFRIPALPVTAICAGFAAAACLMVLLLARRIKPISPRTLLAE